MQGNYWSLIDFGEDNPALPLGHPFSNVLIRLLLDIYYCTHGIAVVLF